MHRLSLFKSFKWKLCLAVAAIILADYLFYKNGLSGGYIGIFAFGVLLCLVLCRRRIWQRWQGSVAALCALVFCSALILDPGPLAWTLFWVAISMAALFGMTTPYDDGWLWLQRLVLHGLRSPVAPFIDARKFARVWRKPRDRRFRLRTLVPILALPLGGSAVILILFATANPIIADTLGMIQLPNLSAVTPARLALWFAIFAFSWSLLRARAAQSLIPTFDGRGDLPMAGVSVASVTLSLVLFNILFAIQNLLDIAYLSRALPLPRGMTIAAYVHRGAYPLIVTALMAGLFVLVTLRPGSSTAAVPVIRRLVMLWIVQNMILVASSIQRTLDYVDASMFTALRIHALAWMALVAAGLLLIYWRMLRGKDAAWLINMNMLLAALTLSFFSFFDAGEAAAWWNVRHAREVTGRGPALDLCHLRQLGPSALLPLIELEGRPLLRPFRARVQSVRSDIQEAMIDIDHHGGWTLRNEYRLDIAKKRLETIKPIPLPAGERDCQGILVPHAPPAAEAAIAPVGTTRTLTEARER